MPFADTSLDGDVNRLVFDSGLVRIGAFRCPPSHPRFEALAAPTANYCFVFPRTAVEIEHEHERPFVANANVIPFYNRGAEYRRHAISPDGDRCDWFGVDETVVRDAVRTIDSSVDDRVDALFPATRGTSDAQMYLLQRRLFDLARRSVVDEPLAVEEMVVALLDRVVRTAWAARERVPGRFGSAAGRDRKQLDIAHDAEVVLSARFHDRLRLVDVANAVGLSVFHLCRTFRRATGQTLHQYRHNLRVRHALEPIRESHEPLIEIALESGFSSHSHFTSAFQKVFGRTPSVVRDDR